ncbi:MAG: MBL fold metallo-hydrolase [Candidatus Parcubacteria bacterium]|nr:MBL fold metallo-hydrolase [Candidatus Parcubacteria bacterium]
MKLHFYGGAKVVTGANYLIECGQTKLMVDCGLFQGAPELQELNYQPFPYDPKSVNFVLITHSHLDHCGRLAQLVRHGFRGQIICTPPTRDLMAVALEDAVRLLEEEAREKNMPPMYEEADLQQMLKLIKVYEYEQKIKINNNVTIQLNEAGHILGSTIYEIWLTENDKKLKLVFTGDLGNPPTPLLKPPAKITETDYLIIESAYGDRNHEPKKLRKEILRQAIIKVISRKGILLMPSFAIERTQELLSELNDFVEHKLIPPVAIFIDSPLAIKITAVYKKHQNYFNEKTRYIIAGGDDIFSFPGLKFTMTRDESKQIIKTPAPKIIIAGSGMSTGGRILYHEKEYLGDPNNCFLVIGFQVEGTLGRKILDGTPLVEILGTMVKNKAEIQAIGAYSAHADQSQLLKFINNFNNAPKNIFIVQGEQIAAEALKNLVKQKSGFNAEVPAYEQEFEL